MTTTKKETNARLLAAQVLMQVNNEQGYSNLVLSSRLEGSGLSERDKAFAAALVYGVLERKITLDYCIAANSDIEFGKIDKEVLEILRISIYSLLYMDSVPDAVAVSEGVALAKAMRKTSAEGFINAVLRSFVRRDKQIVPKGHYLTEKGQIALDCAAPNWLVNMFVHQFGLNGGRKLLEATLGKPPIYLRVNSLKTTPEELIKLLQENGIEAELTVTEGCVLLKDGAGITSLPGFEQGLFHVQDRASQLCALELGAQPGERVLDVCAAPGGKTFTIAQMMQNTGEIVACDISGARLGLIESGAKRLGIDIIKTLENDAKRFKRGFGTFDRVLCDVPCSGLGIIRRKPEIKHNKNPDEIYDLPELQYKILTTSAKYLKVGGVLIYSTCTLNRVENSYLVTQFMVEHPEFEPVPVYDASKSNGNMRTMYPPIDNTDGFFVAAMRRVK